MMVSGLKLSMFEDGDDKEMRIFGGLYKFAKDGKVPVAAHPKSNTDPSSIGSATQYPSLTGPLIGRRVGQTALQHTGKPAERTTVRADARHGPTASTERRVSAAVRIATHPGRTEHVGCDGAHTFGIARSPGRMQWSAERPDEVDGG